MNTIKTLATSVAFASAFSFGGILSAYHVSGNYTDTYRTHLSNVDSLSFLINNNRQQMSLKKGKSTVKIFNIKDLSAISIAVRDTSEEFMVVESNVYESPFDTLQLKNVQSIEIYEAENEKDSDGDGLSDFDEKFKYDTNPMDIDTDGDGWTDKDELLKFNPNNPLKWNPKIADLPQLSIEVTQTPKITLNVSVNQNSSETESVTISESTTASRNISKTSTATSQHQTAFMMGQSHSFGTEFAPLGAINKTNYSFTLNSSLTNTATTSSGISWTDGNVKSATKNNSKTESATESQGKTISGSSIFMQLKLRNTGNIAYTVQNIAVAASLMNAQGESQQIAELLPCGDKEMNTISNIGTLNAGDTVNALFCNRSVPRSFTESPMVNPGILFADAIEKKLTYMWPSSTAAYDFTNTYTNASAKTAHISIDYGTQTNHGTKFKDFRVSTNYRLNNNPNSSKKFFNEITLAEALRIADVNFVEDEICLEDQTIMECDDLVYGIKSIDGVAHNPKKNAFWLISIRKDSDPNNVVFYSPFQQDSLLLDSIFISPRDEILISYSIDEDGDNVPLSVEQMYGTSDQKKDSDGDGLSDYEEINGWPCATLPDFAIVKTNPLNKDTDGDGIIDPEDDDPLHRPASTNANIKEIKFFNENSKSEAVADSNNNLSYNVEYITDSLINVRIFTETPVKSVRVKYSGNEYLKTSEGTEYNFYIPTKVSEKYMEIVITPEEGDDEKHYTAQLNYALIVPSQMDLHVSDDKKSIIVNFKQATGSLIDGYIVVRGVAINDTTDNPELFKLRNPLPSEEDSLQKIDLNERVVPQEGLAIGYNLSIAGVVDKNTNSFTDNVGIGSPYYSYRVYAYHCQNNTCFYSDGSNIKTRSAGRIKGYCQLRAVGTEYFSFGILSGIRYSMHVRAKIFSGNSTLGNYDYFFNPAGSFFEGNTITWEYDKDSDKKKIDTVAKYFDIGKEGLKIELSNHAEALNTIDTKASVEWSHEQLANALDDKMTVDGTQKTAPFDSLTNTLTWGDKDISFDNDCSNCGYEPHAGFKFKIHYEWAE